MVLKKERKSITMNIIKKLLIPVAIAAMVSLGLAGCDKKGKKPAIEQSAKEGQRESIQRTSGQRESIQRTSGQRESIQRTSY